MSQRNEDVIKKYAQILREAEDSGISIEQPISVMYPEISIEEAYAIQLLNIDQKLKEGHKVVGKKIGLTSVAMQQVFNVDQPDYGHLLDSMEVKNGASITMDKVMQPKIEGEIAFVLKEDLKGPNVTTEDVIAATDYIVPSIEIVCSRIKDWKIKLEDTVADNASSGLFILGDNKFAIDQVDIINKEMKLYKNGVLVNQGRGEDAFGNPAYCVAWLANKLSEFGVTLKKGEVILSGALSAAVSAEANDTITVSFSNLGDVTVKFV